MSIRLADWRDRLAERTDFQAFGAADFALAQKDVRRDALYVMYTSEDPDERRTAAPNQLHRYGVSVVLAVRNSRDPRGQAALDDMEAKRGPVLRALLGWTPPGAAGGVSYRRGLLQAVSPAGLWWEDQFEVPALTEL